MKKVLFFAVVLAACMACDPEQNPKVKDPIKVSSPQPKTQITKVDLTAEETSMVKYGNKLTFNLFPLLKEGDKSFIFSPLSIQYALGMTANGAAGETLSQMLQTLGFWNPGQELVSSDIDAMNDFCNKLLNELPAVDLGVKLQLADAILVNDRFPLLPAFKEKVESTYYAAVENMSFDDPATVAARINDWASRNTNGLIKKMLDAGDISPTALAFLMNALYFKAPWVPDGSDPLFMEGGTKNEAFYAGGKTSKVPMMHTSRWFNYADMGSFRLLEIPYSRGQFAMYILLPEKDGFDQLISSLPTLDWSAAVKKLKSRDVILNLPKFETSSSYRLNQALQQLGMTLAFTDAAQFDRMFEDPRVQACIDMVIQKARISVTEWGTEAAAVTVVGMKATSAGPGEEPPVEFICDHPFAYLIAEKSSGSILFAGAYCGN